MAEQTTGSQAARPRTYTDVYRQQVVDMVTSTGRTAMSVAAELGIHRTLISRWIRRYGRTGQAPTLPAMPTSQLKPVRCRMRTRRPSQMQSICPGSRG